MKRIILNFRVWLAILSCLGLYGCAAGVIGVGAAGAAGAFSYFSGKLTKTYQSDYHDAVRAGSATLEELKIPLTETIADELKTEMLARRPDGTPVAIEVVRIDRQNTQVSVRTGSFGLWDKRVSAQIQDYISQNLSRPAIGPQNKSQGSGRDDVRSAAGEGTGPQIIEEDLDDNSVQATAPSGPIAGFDDQAGAQKPPKFDQLGTESIFIIFFQQNSNDLSEESIEKLDRVSEILASSPHTEVMLNGYSDSIGSDSYNQMISEIRANAVKSYLVGKGIGTSRITAFGHGAQKFIASNKTAEGRQLNRRVEIELVTP